MLEGVDDVFLAFPFVSFFRRRAWLPFLLRFFGVVFGCQELCANRMFRKAPVGLCRCFALHASWRRYSIT